MWQELLSLFEPPLSRLEESEAAKLAWLVRLRWIALCAQALSIFPALHFQLLEPRILPGFTGVIAALVIVNALTWGALRRGAEIEQHHVLIQLTADVMALGALLAMTGGAWNPLVTLLFFHAALGAFLLEGRISLVFFWILIACLTSVQMAPYIPPGLAQSRIAPEILFPAQTLVALMFWLLTSWLSRTLTTMQSYFAELRDTRRRIDRLRAVGALAAGLSHEFATPLNTAMLKLGRLRRKHGLWDHPDLDQAIESLERCEDVLRHMAGSQLRPEGLELEVLDVANLVDQVCAAAASDDPDAPLRLLREGRGSTTVRVPSIALSQALLNLVDNARESGAPDRAVDVVVRTSRGQVSVEICDRGPGWPEVVRAHLGEPFVTTKAEGVGLGLYYAYTLAAAVGGDLRLDDRVGGGAIARLVLPLSSPGMEVLA
ncbi:MAG: HAMP domain-containing histidine kinase [bacterium]|nr:HAMP domain-containing histidine kinase [bacterium]